MKKALIFGVTGQDGAYLSEFLLKKGYEVHGVTRRSSTSNTSRIDSICQENADRFFMHMGDLSDGGSIFSIIQKTQPDEIYNLAAQSMVRDSFDIPEYTAEVNALGTLRILEAIKMLGLVEKSKYYQASTSELYGLAKEAPQDEQTVFYPRSPYAISKLFAYWTTINYREAYGIFACNGILFNHESPLRGETFVTRKITHAAVRIKLGKQDTLSLGNLDAKRDWGYAEDYVEAMWLILQQETPEDFVVATGEPHSVREFVECAFKELGIEIEWQGTGVEEQGIDKETKKVLVHIDPVYYRPTEVHWLEGNAKKAEQVLEWHPKTSFRKLVEIMVKADYERELNLPLQNYKKTEKELSLTPQ
jgi:GDPmannose 4,6-dehydratase